MECLWNVSEILFLLFFFYLLFFPPVAGLAILFIEPSDHGVVVSATPIVNQV